MVEISNDAQAVLDKAGPGAKDYVLKQGGFGNRLTSGEASRLLNGFTAENITEDASRPTDLLGIRDQIYNKYGVNDALKNVNDTKAKLRNVDIDVNDAVSMSKLVGQRGKAAEALNNQLQSYTDVLTAAQNQADRELQYKEQERAKLENLMLNAPGAGIVYADTYESAIRKYNNYLEKQRKKEEKKLEKAMKNKNYEALFNAYGTTASARPKGMSKRDYLKYLEKEYGSLADTLSQRAKFSTSGGSSNKIYQQKFGDPENPYYRITDAAGNVLAVSDAWGNPITPPSQDALGNDTNNGGVIYNAGNAIAETVGGWANGVSNFFQNWTTKAKNK